MTGRTMALGAALAAAIGFGGTGAWAQAAGDAAEGEKLFRKCSACHSVEPGDNGAGPSLHGVVGRPVASVEGFEYSDAMRAWAARQDPATGWTPELLDTYLEQPRKVVEGTRMIFAGLRDPADRAAVIAYLQSLK